MVTQPRRRKPLMPSLTIGVGLLVGVAGLVMTILGIGGVSVTHLSVSNALDLQTTSGGIIAMVIGFGLAAAIILMAMRVDEERARNKTETKESYTEQHIRFE